MFDRSIRTLTVVFFCSSGWVYAASATGAEPADLTSAEAPAALATQATPAPTPAPAPVNTAVTQGQNVKVGSFGQIDLHVKDLELSKVLQLLSIQSQRNIIATREVNGSVTADLYGVDFYEAMDAILHSNGFGYREKGNFIYVYTAAQIQKIDEATRKTVSKVVRLNYINAADASAFVTPLLSSAGAISLSGTVTEGFQPSLSNGGANKFAHADTLVVRDWPDNIEQILAVLKELDIRPKQVMVEATVLEAKLDEANGVGVDLSVVADFRSTDFVTNPLSAVSDLVSGEIANKTGEGFQTSTASSNLRDNATMKAGVVSKNVSAVVNLLDQVTDTTVLANPKLLVLNRMPAELLVGERLPYLSTTQTETATTQTVEFMDIGTQLTLRPFVSEDGYIRLELKPSVSSGDLKAVGDQQLPRTATEELTTNVILRSGQTAVLGGLFKETTTVGRRQVPGLGDVPILGNAFRGQDDTIIRSEVIFLVTPTIVKDESLYAAGETARNAAELSRIGSREGLLPWSRTKLTAAHLRKARELMDQGDRDKAMMSVDMALNLDPTLYEARRMKEQLSGRNTYWPTDSMLHDTVNTLIKEQMKAPSTPGAEAPAPAPEAAAPSAATQAPTETSVGQAAEVPLATDNPAAP